jgi:hypothetical protein
VNYRKQCNPSKDLLLPPDDFRLFAVCSRHPAGLARQNVTLEPVRAGVYDTRGLGLSIRVIVVTELPTEEQNAMLHLFSYREELLEYGRQHYRQYSSGMSTLLANLFRVHEEELNMSEKLQKYLRETLDQFLKSLPPEERLKGMSAEELRKALPAEELRNALPVEERLKGLTPDELLKALPPETLEILAAKPRTAPQSAKPE